MSIFKKEAEWCIGRTSHCVWCGKLLEESSIGCGHVMKGDKIILAHFCNQICLRNLGFAKPDWNGMWWIEDYGVNLYDKPINLHI